MNSQIIFKEEIIVQIKDEFRKLKSNFILKKIFNIMNKNKLLLIVKYNKKLQNRLNLSIKDYKEYSELYSPIEIELKLVDNKYGYFINILYKDKEYYHIYFDNSNEEIKRCYLEDKEKVNTIRIIIDYQVKLFNDLFVIVIVLIQSILKNFIELI